MLIRVRRIAIILLSIYWLALFVGTHIPLRKIGLPGNDKLLHLLAYGGLAFLLAWAVAGARPTWRSILAVLLVVSTYGIVDELTQSLIPSRSSDLGDWIADVAGALFGLVCYRVTLPFVQPWCGAADPPQLDASQSFGKN